MDRRTAIAKMRSIVQTHLDMVRAECGPRGSQALTETVADLQGLIQEIYADQETVGEHARRVTDAVDGE